MVFIWILLATFIVSLISLVGALTLVIKSNIFDKVVFSFIGFAAGALIGGAFLHILPEAIAEGGSNHVFCYVIVGFSIFFLMEKYLHWRHCHEGKCEIHTFTYLSLIGDGMHNFVDGLVIAASFVTDLRLGVVTTLAVIFHEIPQEMGDFGILVYGGFSKRKALLCNFICSLTAILGAIIGYIVSSLMKDTSLFLISFTAGGFIYIAASDLIPELHKQKNIKRSGAAFVAFVLGLVFMALTKFIME
ncbi:MAG: ZIP family metal transporter [Candidatus Omnitrophica bacterium CG07_land_8_20_14_0_80_42_15]|uniref:ZIP family metal transporter n=1 Tax=Candidatus Aquitaenariimonas noxiae TaxID=1974741 RepID=A0A2J0L0Y3_9BACT|nr:MAG: ZIP family metal transporter [Candidatus Omnitrophica bacterium CG07_land_8_20_14_0_80_42_15]